MSSITESGSWSASAKAPRTCRTTATFSGRAGRVRRTSEPLSCSPSPSPGEERSSLINKFAVPSLGAALTVRRGQLEPDRMFGHRGSKHDMMPGPDERSRAWLRDGSPQERIPLVMSEGHRLHETRVEGGVEPAGAFTVEPRPAPPGVCLVELSGELDFAATASVRTCVDEAGGSRGLVLDLSGATFLDSSMLKELLRASAELARYDTPLVLADVPSAVRRVL